MSAVQAFTEALDALFALPLEEKRKLRASLPGTGRGYIPQRAEKLSPTAAADLFEAFEIGSQGSDFPGLDLPPAHYPPNNWPPLLGFREVVEKLYAQLGEFTRRLTGIFSYALGVEESYFVPFTDHPIATLRMNHYPHPGTDSALDRNQIGMGAHTDYGILTVLWVDNVQGLQVLTSRGSWLDVRPEPGCLLVNLGDLLARWTNDRWRSALHRVLPPTDDEGNAVRRRSAAYFHDGNWDAEIRCLPNCIPPGATPRYQPITIGQYITERRSGRMYSTSY
ncbi:2OG-Fe(II) oxygenase [Streptomyces noursei ATCC 11455]|nr:dioxygenase, isopenicillin N synthase [Streptomyces noursei ATCC 11455]ANZ21844.1 2OG-Fe(II) oxygenase [Streptomyces noursei ATCC 11455]